MLNTLQKQAFNLARKALQIGSNFAHPVSDDRSGSQDYPQVEEKQEAANTLL
ncbi:hypothetical protein HMPREF1586_01227, partial [Gardnerella vaginalis JCP8522]